MIENGSIYFKGRMGLERTALKWFGNGPVVHLSW